MSTISTAGVDIHLLGKKQSEVSVSQIDAPIHADGLAGSLGFTCLAVVSGVWKGFE